MARLYANENFPVEVVGHLRALGHDVLTTHDVGKSNQGIEDDAVLRFAIETNRCVITINRRDFMRLHRGCPFTPGSLSARKIVTIARSRSALMKLSARGGELANQLIRVVRGD